MKIGVLDSGFGGLSVLKTAVEMIPNEDFVYFADTKNAPYGRKTRKEVRALVLKSVEFLTLHDVKGIVVACNTGTSVAVKQLRKIYDIPIIGMEPAIKPALQINEQKKVLLFATKLTLKEKKLHKLIHKLEAEERIDMIALQELVRYAEDFDFSEKTIVPYLMKKLRKVSWKKYSSVVLGCTHFLFFKKYFEKMLPEHIQIVDGNEGTVRHLINNIELSKSKKKGKIEYFNSGKKIKQKVFKKYMKLLK